MVGFERPEVICLQGILFCGLKQTRVLFKSSKMSQSPSFVSFNGISEGTCISQCTLISVRTLVILNIMVVAEEVAGEMDPTHLIFNFKRSNPYGQLFIVDFERPNPVNTEQLH